MTSAPSGVGDGRVRAVTWALIVLLVLVGLNSALTRAIVVSSVIAGAPADGFAPRDRESLALAARLLKLEPGSPRYAQMESDFRVATAKYSGHAPLTLLHVGPGALFLLFLPLQLVRGLRERFRALHRWSGRVLLLIALPVGLTGLFLAVNAPVSGPVGGAAAVSAGLLFLFAGARAFMAIRQGDVATHRAWMIRFTATALGIALIRVLDLVLLATTSLSTYAIAGPSFWMGWMMAVLAAEWWIRGSRVPVLAPQSEAMVDASGAAAGVR